MNSSTAANNILKYFYNSISLNSVSFLNNFYTANNVTKLQGWNLIETYIKAMLVLF